MYLIIKPFIILIPISFKQLAILFFPEKTYLVFILSKAMPYSYVSITTMYDADILKTKNLRRNYLLVSAITWSVQTDPKIFVGSTMPL